MTARFEIGDVLLATRIGCVFREVFIAVMPGNPSLGQSMTKNELTLGSKLGSFTEGQNLSLIEGTSQFELQAGPMFRFGNLKRSLDVVRHLDQ